MSRSIPIAFLLILSTLVLFVAPAHAQDTDTPPRTEVTVTEEPGVCSNGGAFCERLLDWTGSETFAETVSWILGTPIRVLTIVALAVIGNRLARRLIRRTVDRVDHLHLPESLVSEHSAERSTQRASAVGALLRSTASVVIYGIASIAVLDNLGVSVVPVLASLGIAGVAIGFGAQTLVEDLISGILLVVEDQLGVGDRVDVGVVEGVVTRLTLRSTVILAGDGVLWFVPNSEIRRVANESQHTGRASVQIGVAYSADLREAISVLHRATQELVASDRWRDAGIEDVPEPFVASLSESAIILETRIFVKSDQRRKLERELREHYVAAANAADLELPYNQLDVWLRTPPS